jgi:signal transduction histidine kinase
MSTHNKFVHDMKNLLSIVIGYSTLLLEQMPADDARRADLDEIRRAGDGALALLNGWSAAPADIEHP